MRDVLLRARLRRGEEEGATLLVVALVLVVIFGMLVLTVDIGGALVMRRRLVNAADAAALAAAQSCGKKEGKAGADATAAQYTIANVPVASVLPSYPRYAPNCDADSGTVTVKVEATTSMPFASVLGGGTSRPVTATAVARWGGTAHGSFLPFMLSLGMFSTCGIPDTVSGGDRCMFWLDNSPDGLATSDWAMLNLTLEGSSRWGWDVPRDYSGCTPANTNDTIEWIHNPPDLYLNYPEPTFVCVDTGATPPTFKELEDWANSLNTADPNTTFMFPVNDPDGRTDQKLAAQSITISNRPHGQVNRAGVPCPPSSCTPAGLGPLDKFDIVGFAELKIVEIQRGNRAEGGNVTCGGYDPDPNAWCLVTEWVEYHSQVSKIEAQNFGVVVVRLIE